MLKYGENLYNNIIGIETKDASYTIEKTVKVGEIKVEVSNSGVPIMYLILDHSNNVMFGIPSGNVTKVYFK